MDDKYKNLKDEEFTPPERQKIRGQSEMLDRAGPWITAINDGFRSWKFWVGLLVTVGAWQIAGNAGLGEFISEFMK